MIDYSNHRLYKNENFKDLKNKSSIFKKVNNGKSNSIVYYFEINKNKHIIKYNEINDKFIKEIFIHLQINEIIKNFVSEIIQFGILEIKDKKYLYYISEFIEGLHIKDLYTSNIIKNKNKLKKIYIDFLKKYKKVDNLIEFIHMDIQNNNIIYDLKKKILILIDMGTSYTDKYPYTFLKKTKKKIEIPIKTHIFPYKNIQKTSFNYNIKDITFSQNKEYRSIKKLNTNLIDLINILKLYNTGVRMLFNDINSQIEIKDRDAMILNSKRKRYTYKIDYCIKLICSKK